jgi:hypothetical protein
MIMVRNRVRRFVGFGVAFVLAVPLFGFFVMSLWNWLMPTLFGLHTLTFWQALGLLILSRTLLGSFGGRSHGRGYGRQRILERLTPEQREQFRERMRNGCGDNAPPSSSPRTEAGG